VVNKINNLVQEVKFTRYPSVTMSGPIPWEKCDDISPLLMRARASQGRERSFMTKGHHKVEKET